MNSTGSPSQNEPLKADPLIRPVASYAELIERLGQLPKPREGHVRIYRGQTKPYPLLPSALRPGGSYRKHIWRSYMRAVANGMPGAAHHLSEPFLQSIWVEAIAQHYGSGSRFLDVTTDVDIALWFALHEAKNGTSYRSPMKSPPDLERVTAFGVVDAIAEVLIAEHVTHYARFEETGWLYVLDVPHWNGQSEPAHGCLIDLSKAPPFLQFAASERMNAQCACLLAAERKIDSTLYACAPVPVLWPPDGNDRLRKPVDAIFPRPDDDPWYSLFLSIPLHTQRGPPEWATDPRRGEGWIVPVNLRWERPLPIVVYSYDLREEHTEACAPPSDNLLAPPSIYAVLPLKPAAEAEGMAKWINQSDTRGSYELEKATVIALESPLISTLPSLDLWNHSLLHEDIATDTESFFARQIPEGPVITDEDGNPRIELTDSQRERYEKLIATPFTLTNVFIEFAPLEEIAWSKLGNSDIKVLRAAWLLHNRKRFILFLYYQSLPSTSDIGLSEEGPFYYQFDEDSGYFYGVMRNGDKWSRTTVPGGSASDRPFFGILSLIRALSPGPGLELKADPFPLKVTKNTDWHFVVVVRRRSAHLVHASFLPDGREVLGVRGSTMSSSRGWYSNEPYDWSSSPIYGTLELSSEAPWRDVNVTELRKWIDEKSGH